MGLAKEREYSIIKQWTRMFYCTYERLSRYTLEGTAHKNTEYSTVFTLDHHSFAVINYKHEHFEFVHAWKMPHFNVYTSFLMDHSIWDRVSFGR